GIRVQADVVGNGAHLAHARPEGIHRWGVAFVAGQRPNPSQKPGRILRAVGVVGGADSRLVGNNVDGRSKGGELNRHRRDEIVADQDVLVLFLHQLIALRHYHFHYVLADRQHGGAGPVGIGRVGIPRTTNGAVRPGGLSGRRIHSGNAGELVHAVVRRRLELIPVVHAVVALVLRVARQGVQSAPILQRGGEVEVVRLVIQREIENIAGRLARAVHVGHAIGPETLRPVVPTAGLGGVNQRQGLAAIRRRPLLVKVDGYTRDQGLPNVLGAELRIVKWTGRGIDDMTPDTAILAGRVGLLAEFQEIVLSGEALPRLGQDPGRIDSAGGPTRTAGTACYRSSRDGKTFAVRIAAINRARYPQVSGHRDLFHGIRKVIGNHRGG